MPIGAKVTLRQDKMWEFMDRLFNTRTFLPSSTLWAGRVGLLHLGHTVITLQA